MEEAAAYLGEFLPLRGLVLSILWAILVVFHAEAPAYGAPVLFEAADVIVAAADFHQLGLSSAEDEPESAGDQNDQQGWDDFSGDCSPEFARIGAYLVGTGNIGIFCMPSVLN